MAEVAEADLEDGQLAGIDMNTDELRLTVLEDIDGVLDSPKVLFVPEAGRRMLRAQRRYWATATTAALMDLATVFEGLPAAPDVEP